MESAAAAHGGGLLLLMKLGSINIIEKPLFPLKSPNLFSHYSFRRSYISTIATNSSRNSRWDSNAENFKSQKFKFKFRDKNKRFRDNDDIEEEEEEEGKGKKRRWWSEELDIEEEEAPSILEEVIDSLWILKVLKSYGWALPPIIVSWLIATGPKAFLMALALPLGQSTISFVFQKLWGRTQNNPRYKARKRRKPFVGYPSDAQMDEKKEAVEEWPKTVKRNKRFRSWEVKEDDGSVKQNNRNAPSFGGWDELDKIKSMGRPPRRAGTARKRPLSNGRLSEIGRERDAPLLLRLLIALFPFLGSWTKML